jgi:hypothetical protein
MTEPRVRGKGQGSRAIPSVILIRIASGAFMFRGGEVA